MDVCNVDKCKVSCQGGETDSSLKLDSKTVNGVIVHVSLAMMNYGCITPMIIQGVTFKPKGSVGATCNVDCEGLKFSTTCKELTGKTFAWTKPDDLTEKCGEHIQT